MDDSCFIKCIMARIFDKLAKEIAAIQGFLIPTHPLCIV